MNINKMNAKYVFCVLILLTLVNTAYGETPRNRRMLSFATGQNRDEFFSDVAKDMGKTFSSPFYNWDCDRRLTALAILGGGGLLMLADEPVTNWFRQKKLQQNKLLKGVACVAEKFGSFKKAGIGVGLFFLITRIVNKKNKTYETAGLMVRGAISTYAVVKLFKIILGRERPMAWYKSDDPYAKRNAFKFHWFETKNKYNSMPSGHSAMAFSLATVAAMQYKASKPGKTNIAGIISYTIAGLTALSRIYDEQHWLSDTFIGSVLGVTITRFVVNRHYKDREQLALETYLNGPSPAAGFIMPPYRKTAQAGKLQFQPIMSLNGLGVSMNIQF
jgi:membrane-associated phospholipid phosphatase